MNNIAILTWHTTLFCKYHVITYAYIYEKNQVRDLLDQHSIDGRNLFPILYLRSIKTKVHHRCKARKRFTKSAWSSVNLHMLIMRSHNKKSSKRWYHKYALLLNFWFVNYNYVVPRGFFTYFQHYAEFFSWGNGVVDFIRFLLCKFFSTEVGRYSLQLSKASNK